MYYMDVTSLPEASRLPGYDDGNGVGGLKAYTGAEGMKADESGRQGNKKRFKNS
jgi:hypothetical protein